MSASSPLLVVKRTPQSKGFAHAGPLKDDGSLGGLILVQWIDP
jgi:hypothetical protein